MKRISKCISLLLILTLILSVIPAAAFEGMEPNYLPEADIDDDILNSDCFYFGSTSADMQENGGSYILRVARGNADLSEKSVRITATDLNASYGKDYTFEEYKGKAKVYNKDESMSVAEVIAQDPESAQEYNYTDALADGSLDPTQTPEEEAAQKREVMSDVTESDVAQITQNAFDAMGIESENGTEEFISEVLEGENYDVSEGEDCDVWEDENSDEDKQTTQSPLNSLESARERALGVDSRRVPMSGGNSGSVALDTSGMEFKQLEELNEVLKSTYIILDFEKGETEKFIKIKIKDNSKGEGDKRFNLDLTAESKDAKISQYRGISALIIDDEEPEMAKVSLSDSVYYPEDGFIKVYLNRTGPSNQIVSVKLYTENDTAQSGRDFSEIATTITFPYSINERRINIPIRSKYFEEDKVRFKVFLDQNVGCDFGDITEAECIISKSDIGYDFDAQDDSASPMEAVNAGRLAENKIPWSSFRTYASGNSKGVCKVEDDNMIMYAEYKWNYLADTNYVHIETDLGHTPFYNGVRVKWKMEHGGAWCDAKTTVYQNDVSCFNDTSNSWEMRSDNAVFTQDYTDKLKIRVFRDTWGGSPKATVESVTPILRPIEVTLKQAAPLYFTDREGTLRPNDEIPENRTANMTYIPDADTVTGTVTKYLGDYITVKMWDANPKAYIKGLLVTSPDGKMQKTLGYNTSGKDTLSVPVKDLESCLTTFKSFADKSKGKYAVVNVQPILDYYDTPVYLHSGRFASLSTSLPADKDASGGDTKKFIAHKGDFIRIKQTVDEPYKDMYLSKQIRLEPEGGLQTSGDYDIEDGADYVTCYADFASLNAYPLVQNKGNKLRVRIAAADDDKFKADWKTTYEKVKENGIDYCEYIIADEADGSFVQNKWYEINAARFGKDSVSVWNGKFCQESFYFKTSEFPEENVVYLEYGYADSVPVIVKASAFYNDVPIGATHGATHVMAAEGLKLIADGIHYGVSDKDGNVSTTPVNVVSRKAGNVCIRVKICANGSEEYYDCPIDESRANLSSEEYKYFDEHGDEQTMDCYVFDMGNVYAPTINQSIPYPIYAKATANGNNTNMMIMIDNLIISGIDIGIANNGATYADSDGVLRSEKVTSMELLVYNGTTNKYKSTLGEAQYDYINERFVFNDTFKRGDSSSYQSGDRLYVRMTTTRFIGNGKIQDGDGNWKDCEAMRETVYAPINTGITFTELEPKPEIILDIPEMSMDKSYFALPFIGDMTTAIVAMGINVSVEKLADNKQRLGFGIAWPTYDPDHSKSADKRDEKAIVKPGEVLEVIDTIKATGKKLNNSGSAATAGMKAWSFAPIVGLYIDFAQRQNPTTGKVDFFFCGGGAYGGITGNFRLTGYLIVGVFPLYMGVDFTGQAVLNIGFTKLTHEEYAMENVNEWLDNSSKIGFQFSLVTNILVSVYAGVGLDHTIGVRGGFTLGFSFIFDPTIKIHYPDFRMFGVRLTYSFTVWIDAFLMTIPFTFATLPDTALGYYEDIAKTIPDRAALMGTPMRAEQKKERNSKSVWRGSRQALKSSYGNAQTSVIKTGGYDKASPQLIQLNDGKALLVFVDDEPDRDDDNYTAVKYSIFDGYLWTEPKIIQDDGTADFQPNVCDALDKILITWVSKMDDGPFNTAAALNSFDVFCVMLDKNTGELGEITRLTNDNRYNCDPVGVFNYETHDMQVFYHACPDFTEDMPIEKAINPLENGAMKMFMYYDAGEGRWLYDHYYSSDLKLSSDAEYFVGAYKGQRFLNTNIERLSLVNPPVSSFGAGSYGRYSVLAYSVDADSNLDTTEDTELVIQLYDTRNHIQHKPICITKGNVSNSRPQIVTNVTPDENGDPMECLYLFWLENGKDISYTDLSELINNGIDENGNVKDDFVISKSTVFFGNGASEENRPSFMNFTPFADNEGHMFITWTEGESDENGKLIGSQIYASAYIDYAEDENGFGGTAWSEGVKLSENHSFNDELAILVDESDRMMIVNNRYDLDMDSDVYNPTNVALISTVCEPVNSVSAVSATIDDKTEILTDGKIRAKIKFKNTGLKPTNGFIYKITNLIDGQEVGEPVEGSDDTVITPSAIYEREIEAEVPADAVNHEYKLRIETADKDISSGRMLVYTTEPIEFKPEYEITDAKVTQTGDDFRLKCTVKNIGSADAGENSEDRILVEFNDIYYSGAGGRFADEKIGALKTGESKGLDVLLNIPDSKFANGYCNAVITAVDKETADLSKNVPVIAEILNPFNITLEGAEDNKLINMITGQTITLNADYSPKDYYIGGEIKYSVDDLSIASVSNGKLTANSEGETYLRVFVDPYGGNKEYTVIVNSARRSSTSDEKEKTGGKTNTETDSKTDDKSDSETDKNNDTNSQSKSSLPFTDVKKGDWYYDAVKSAYENGLMNGTEKTLFEPNADITRAMFVSVLYRFEGEPAFMNDLVFDDVERNSYYEKAVVWANGKGIVKGVSDTEFAPDEFITREQMAAIIYRYAKYKGIAENSEIKSKLDFADSEKISDYAYDALCWANGEGIINGRENNILAPLDYALRAELAQILLRLKNLF